MIIRKLFGMLILVVSFIIVHCNLNAQQIPDNQIYEHERLFFNDLLVLRNHNLLLVRDRMHESRRKMFLLDSTNQVVDSMKTDGIMDMLVFSDTCFFVNGFNYSVLLTIRNNRFVLSKIITELFDFKSAFGQIAFLNGNTLLFQKQTEDNKCNSYDAVKQGEELVIVPRLPFSDEKSTYKLSKNDTIKMLSIKLSGMIYSFVSKKKKKAIGQNAEIKTYSILSSEGIGINRTKIIYGKDNLEWNNDSLFIYEKNSCAIYCFYPKDNFKQISCLKFPVENQTIEGWKYLFDVNTKTHYAVKRTKNIVAKNINDIDDQVRYQYSYTIYKADLLNGKLNEICVIGFDPVYIANGFVYRLLSNSQLSSSKILVYPLDSSNRIEKKILIQ